MWQCDADETNREGDERINNYNYWKEILFLKVNTV